MTLDPESAALWAELDSYPRSIADYTPEELRRLYLEHLQVADDDTGYPYWPQ